ncbi:hypothetical protein C0J52_05934 [Blattella germanica]|nr:hypothetical protein C0J52_05934 [Blattella germanica]
MKAMEERTYAEGPADADNSVFGADIDGATGYVLETQNGGDVDDDTSLSTLVLAHVLKAEECTSYDAILKTKNKEDMKISTYHVYSNLKFPFLVVEDSCVVDDNVQRLKGVSGLMLDSKNHITKNISSLLNVLSVLREVQCAVSPAGDSFHSHKYCYTREPSLWTVRGELLLCWEVRGDTDLRLPSVTEH